MITKYVCLVEGCNFATDSIDEAGEHAKEHHEGMANAGASITLSDDGNLDCQLMA